MARTNKELYSQFLLSTFGRYSMVWLARLLDNQPAHDSWTRWLTNTKLRPSIIWEDVREMVDLSGGYLIVDDTVSDKWYAKQIEMVKNQYSGTHHRLVNGINVVSLLWTKHLEPERAEHITVDFRVYAPRYDGKSKHHHARDMLESAFYREFVSPIVVFDSWYTATKTLKLINNDLKWTFVGAIPSDRQVCTEPKAYRSVDQLATKSGIVCWMKKYGQVKVFKLVRPDKGDIEYLATNDLSLTAPVARAACKCRWKIEEYHRGAKQLTGLENCQARSQRAQRNHILCSIMALLALEQWRLERGIPWYEAKQRLIAEAVSHYLKNPTIPLPGSA
jgi:putative transposase